MKIILITLLNILLSATLVLSKSISKVKVNENGFSVSVKIQKLMFSEKSFSKLTVRNYFEFNDESRIGELNLPNEKILIALPNKSKPNIRVLNVKKTLINETIPDVHKDPLDSKTVKDYQSLYSEAVKSDFAGKSIIDDIKYFRIRDFYIAEITLNTVLFDGVSTVSELNSVQLEFEFNNYINIKSSSPIQIKANYDNTLVEIIDNYEIAEQFRIIPNSNEYKGDDWINLNYDYLKLGVKEDAIYRIYPSDLEGFGINNNQIDPRRIKLFRKGIELPIWVYGEDDGLFDDMDYVEFYAEKNYGVDSYRNLNGVGKPNNEYISKYGEETILWLTWEGNNGKRIQINDGIVNKDLKTVDFEFEIMHYEPNNIFIYYYSDIVQQQFYTWEENETWTMGGILGGQKQDLTFNIDNIIPSKEASLYFKFISVASSINQKSHNIQILLNQNELVDSFYIDRLEPKIAHVDFNADLLVNGTNTITIFSRLTEAYVNGVEKDWFDIEYPRSLTLSGDKLLFTLPKGFDSDNYTFQVNDVNKTGYVIYRVDSLQYRISSYLIEEGRMYFNDSSSSGAKYIISSNSRFEKPEMLRYGKINNLLNKTIQTDYILITSKEFESIGLNYTNFIMEQYDITTKLVLVEDIYDQFNFGYFAPEPIKEFLENSYNQWTAPKASFVFFVGESNYDYMNYKQKDDFIKNIVPSYGHPVSDSWFVIWDENSDYPEMYHGRLTASSIDEFQHYFDKHRQYTEQGFSKWNKSVILFSGGSSISDQNLTQSISNNLQQEVFNKRPFSAYSTHFFSTSDPKTNFGPYESAYVDSVIDEGGVIISFVGHSGTQIWDNGVENTNQLNNKYNFNSLISDFGCSTGKFAEPDVVSFSEAFTRGLEGRAIAYIGNSSLGFVSTSSIFPSLMYSELTKMGNKVLGTAHINAKINLIKEYGTSAVNRLFVYSNHLFSDPIIELAIPDKPNLVLEDKKIEIGEEIELESDSLLIIINYFNYGLSDTNTFDILVKSLFDGKELFEYTFESNIPDRDDSLELFIPLQRSGSHTLSITLDPENQINELIETDNHLELNYFVHSSSLKELTNYSGLWSGSENITFLNPTNSGANDNGSFFEIDTSENFSNPTRILIEQDSILSFVKLENLETRRYWYRFIDKTDDLEFYGKNSFYYSYSDKNKFTVNDKYSLLRQNSFNLVAIKDSIQIMNLLIPIKLKSSGYMDFGNAKFELNGTEYLDNSIGCGFHNVLLNKKNLEIEDQRWFNFWNDPYDYSSYYDFLSKIDKGSLLFVTISGSCGGYNLSENVKAELREFGATFINSVKWGTSYIFIGERGNSSSESLEKISFNEPVEIDSVFIRKANSGYMTTRNFDYAEKITELTIDANTIENTGIEVIPINIVTGDTLSSLIMNNSSYNVSTLSKLSAYQLQFQIKLTNILNSYPSFNSLFIDYNYVSELAINYQVVSTERDTITQGQSNKLKFWVYNVGESPADSFNVDVELRKPDNSTRLMHKFEKVSIDSMNRRFFDLKLSVDKDDSWGNMAFNIIVDKEDKVLELYEDNNFYSIPFYVKEDTTVTSISEASLTVTYDGVNINDGDYISPSPEIMMTLNYPAWFETEDTNSVNFSLNGIPIHYKDLSIDYETGVINYKYKPSLKDGEYVLRIFGSNKFGKTESIAGYEKVFQVSNELKLFDVYNYPNPFKDNTSFTFRLTQVPEELYIKVYTVAGRLIREIKTDPSQLKTDFNHIPWDGMDQDGDNIANGVYLYRIYAKSSDGKTCKVTQKLAVVR